MLLRASKSSKLRGSADGTDAIDRVDVVTGVVTLVSDAPGLRCAARRSAGRSGAATSEAGSSSLLRGEVLEVVQVARPSRGGLHSAQVRKTAVADGHVIEPERERVSIELDIDIVGVDSRDPLHDVKGAEICFEPEVP